MARPKKKTETKTGSETIETGFINPFEPGVNYNDFTEAIPEGMTVEEYCKNQLTEEQISFLTEDLEHYKNNKKNQ